MANTFWANPSTDPKRAYRWLLYLNAEDQALPTWVITKVSQPSFEVSEKEHQFINVDMAIKTLNWDSVDKVVLK